MKTNETSLRAVGFALTMFIVVVLAACVERIQIPVVSDESSNTDGVRLSSHESEPPVAEVVASPPGVTVEAGTTRQLAVETYDAGGNLLTGRVVTWTSSDDSIATVDATGLISAHVNGWAAIVATSEGVVDTVLLTVAVPGVPLIDLGTGTYLGFEGGLYPGGNVIPQDHADQGMTYANAIRKLDANGNPDPAGTIVMTSIGMSNAALEYKEFFKSAQADPEVIDHIAYIKGAHGGGGTAKYWTHPDSSAYNYVLNELTSAGYTEAQVQVAWVNTVNANPDSALPSPNAEAFLLLEQFGNIARAMRVRYPNLKLVFFSSRIYGGYSHLGTKHTEPFAYETGFSVKWIIQAQIDQMANGGTVVNQDAGDLTYGSMAPWLGWGAYLWANGVEPNSEGLFWVPEDMADHDGLHPSDLGADKAGAKLLEFFKGSPKTRGWFLSVVSVTVTPASPTIYPGGSVQLTAVPEDGSAIPLTGRDVAWTTSDPGVATVDQTGLVSGVGVGNASITATIDGVQGVASVTVQPLAGNVVGAVTITWGANGTPTTFIPGDAISIGTDGSVTINTDGTLSTIPPSNIVQDQTTEFEFDFTNGSGQLETRTGTIQTTVGTAPAVASTVKLAVFSFTPGSGSERTVFAPGVSMTLSPNGLIEVEQDGRLRVTAPDDFHSGGSFQYTLSDWSGQVTVGEVVIRGTQPLAAAGRFNEAGSFTHGVRSTLRSR